jgi:DNA polymerase-3 subunit epsilon/ATP-dependent DNA helicase DinG
MGEKFEWYNLPMPSFVSLDIETTGTDPYNDAIIEIGAVRFNGRRVEDEWSSLINPNRPIPEFITRLTGISSQMVAQAPTMRTVLAEFADFVSDAVVVGHNVGFDLSFLRRYRIIENNEAMDTYEMASILLPGAERYNLGALAQMLAVPLPGRHRALDDAHVSHGVYLRLHEMTLDLSLDLLAEIVRMGEPLEWNGFFAFQQALRARVRESPRGRKVSPRESSALFGDYAERPLAPLKPKEKFLGLDPDEIAEVLEFGGAFSRHFPHYEHRPEQVAMLRAVTESLSEDRHLMVEAGTGVGKSVAYLVPAALWAVQNNARVVVSTNTINLQEQLIKKDVPDVRQALELDVRAAVLKGRANYLCPRRLESLRRRGPENVEELRVLAKVLVWRQHSSSGDRGEINLNGPAEREAWMRLSAEDEGCTTDTCVEREGGSCPFYRSRQAAQSAHILIVNHALLLSDVATENRVLPEYQYLIVDEAHHLEEATTNALSFQLTQFDNERLLRELGSPRGGALGWSLSLMQDILLPTDYAAFDHLIQRATDHAFQFDDLSRQFFTALEQFLSDQREGKPLGQYAHQERILPATRSQPAWAEVEAIWDDAEHALRPLIETVEKINQALTDVAESIPDDQQDIIGQVGNLYRRLTELHDNLHALVFEPDAEKVYWAEIQPNGRRLSLHAAPLHIGSLMEKHLWHKKASVILTSATLTTAGEFDYLRGRLNAQDADELALGSPFDYETATLLYIANDIPEPADRYGHQRAIDHGLIQLCRATGGRTLVLFTSYAQLRATAQAIAPALAEDDIIVYEQGDGASPHALLETFRASDKAVLLGTRAFWEGVDVPGEALSVLAIAKLPFDVPSDPIVAARAETFEDAFNEYSLPEAILRFRQGFGRLIRTQSDRGVVAVLDKRILTKRYGKVFLESLPKCTLKIGPLANLPKAAMQWLNL